MWRLKVPKFQNCSLQKCLSFLPFQKDTTPAEHNGEILHKIFHRLPPNSIQPIAPGWRCHHPHWLTCSATPVRFRYQLDHGVIEEHLPEWWAFHTLKLAKHSLWHKTLTDREDHNNWVSYLVLQNSLIVVLPNLSAELVAYLCLAHAGTYLKHCNSWPPFLISGIFHTRFEGFQSIG